MSKSASPYLRRFMLEEDVVPFPTSKWTPTAPPRPPTDSDYVRVRATETQRPSPSGPLNAAGAPEIDRTKMLRRVDQLFRAVEALRVQAIHLHIDNPKTAPYNTEDHRQIWLHQKIAVDIRKKYICLNINLDGERTGRGILVVDTTTGNIYGSKWYGIPNTHWFYGNVMTISVGDLAKVWIGRHSIYGIEAIHLANQLPNGGHITESAGTSRIVQKQLRMVGLTESGYTDTKDTQTCHRCGGKLPADAQWEKYRDQADDCTGSIEPSTGRCRSYARISRAWR